MLCFISVLITRILHTVNQEYGEKRRHLQAGNPRGVEKGAQPWPWSTERHSDFRCQKSNKWFKLTDFNQTEAELIYDVMLKWKYAEAHTFTLNMWKNLSLLSLLFCVILCNDRASALLLYFLDQSDSRMVTYCCTWKQQIWVKVI